MLHRLKLRLLYGAFLDKDRATTRKKMRVILISGFLVYIPFLAIAYLIAFETRKINLLGIGLLSSVTCIPVVFYAYAKGFNEPFFRLWSTRRVELLWLAVKIGFLYSFFLYWMILGIVEFLFGYHVVRAAMISFVAAAVARDGFDIGFIRAQSPNTPISIFPDGKSVGPYLKSASFYTNLFIPLLVSGSVGFLLGFVLSNSIYQTFMVGIVGGILTVFSPAGKVLGGTSMRRFFVWPGMIMTATYFLTLAYLVRILFEIRLTPSADLALLTAVPCAWLMAEMRLLQGMVENPLPAKQDGA